jgi:transposase
MLSGCAAPQFHGNIDLYATPVDGRKSFDGLCALVESAFNMQVLDGHLFLFVNRRRDRLKALWWEAGGFDSVAQAS